LIAKSLDGDWTNGTSNYPSGNGTAGGDFNFVFNVLPGDGNGDGIINSQERLSLPSTTNWLNSLRHMLARDACRCRRADEPMLKLQS
jgi:hypothetical protein